MSSRIGGNLEVESCVTGHVFYRAPKKTYPVVERGEGIFLYDTSGKRYLDGCSGALVSNIGHGVEEIVEIMAEQARKVAFAHTSQFTNAPQEDLAGLIANMAPGSQNRVYFVSGGSEATETAIKMARQYHLQRGNRSKHKIIARWISYHGNTLGALSMSGHTGRRRPHEPLLLDFAHIPPAYCYRCPFGSTYPQCSLRCAHALEEAILLEGPENVAAFIAEPVVGASAGAVSPPSEYFRIIREICNQHDVLFIADEVMTGFGRTGRNFAMDHWKTVPDITTTGKGISAGYSPLAAVIATDEVHQAFLNGNGKFIHGHTYGGNPLSCAVGAAVLRHIQRHGLVARAAEMGEYLLERLQGLSHHPTVGDVRGKGLMIGIELVADQVSRRPFEPNQSIAERLGAIAFENGLILYPGSGQAGGIQGDQFMVAPPFIISRSEADLLVELIDRSLTQLEAELGLVAVQKAV